MSAPPPLVLASRSPQRRALLTQLRLPFRVEEPDYEELPLALAPERVVEERSRGKARSVRPRAGDGPVLGVDTEVALDDGVVLGKPATAEEAAAMLRRLAGRPHHVVSGLCVRRGKEERVGHAVTVVTFRALTALEVEAYVGTGEWRGRAGGYAIQGVGAALVARVDGCYPNVVGLPVALLADALEAVGWPLLVVAGGQARAAGDAAPAAGRAGERG
jgi:septum formation protein